MAIRWLIDVGPLWNSSSEFAAALSLIPQQCARNDIEKYHHLNDRKLALASQLLQRLCVSIVTSSSSSSSSTSTSSTSLPVKFKDVVLTRENNAKGGKPITPSSPVQFNVSHHGRIVACVARHSTLGKVGVDVVDVTDGGVPGYVKNRRGSIYSGEGVKSWAEGFGGLEGGVFTDGEMKGIFEGYNVNTTTAAAIRDSNGGATEEEEEGKVSEEDKLLSKKLYRNWCAKEAYVKAVGTGLVTELGRLEIRGLEGFSVTGNDTDGDDDNNNKEKTRYLGVEAWTRESGSDTWNKDEQWRFDMERVKAGAEEYYVCAALECKSGSSGDIKDDDREAWRFLDFERDILEVIRSQS